MDRNDAFLAILSHELRNALGPIRNSLVILDHSPSGSSEAKQAQSIIQRQVEGMTRQIQDLLDVTRIARHKIRLQREWLDLNDVARRAAEDRRAVFQAMRVVLTVTTSPEPLVVHADRLRLAQVIRNLLTNAAKFTPPGGRTTLTVESDVSHGRGILRVADTGCGLGAEALHHVFDAFSTDLEVTGRGRDGLGLGLAIAKGMAELHHGTLTSESPGPGLGSTFTLSLPLCARPAALSPKISPVAGGSGLRLLIIEDNEDAAQTLHVVLTLDGHEVMIAATGTEGVAMTRAHQPDIVLCDIALPDLDGYEVARQINADSQLDSVRLVAISGYAMPQDRRRAILAGFDDHIAKPVDPNWLLTLIREMAASGPSTGHPQQ